MKAHRLHGTALDTLRPVTLPRPTPGPGEVRIRVTAASVNYRDYALATGRYRPDLPRPFIPLSDGVGRVEEVGAGVDDLREGDRVTGLYTTAWIEGPFRSAYHESKLGGPLDGWLAEHIVLPSRVVLKVPDHLDDEQAATLPVSGLTAWTALARLPVRKGARLLVQGTGSVSLMALQLAVARGAEVIATTSSDEKAALLRRLGAGIVLDRRAQPDLARAIREATGGAGVDGIVDVVGGRSFASLLDAAADNGQIAVVGFLDGVEVSGNVIGPIMTKQLGIHGVSVGSRRDFESFLAELARHRIVPVVGERFDFDDAIAAIASMSGARTVGKPVIRVR